MAKTSARGVSILVFLAEGSPEGLRVVERSNWTGVVLVSSAADPTALLARAELEGPGVYLLVGESSSEELRSLYVGEADDVKKRVRQHLAKADERWQQIVVATRKDMSLNKAHVRWLERELISRGRAANRSSLANINGGFASPLHEADVATLESYLEDLLTILPLLGIDSFEVPEVAAESLARTRYVLRGTAGVAAEGYEKGSGFVVIAGTTRAAHTPSTSPAIVNLRSRLLSNGVFEEAEAGTWRLASAYAFDSPSAAAAVLLGRPANGLTEWKTPGGRTLKVSRQGVAGENDET